MKGAKLLEVTSVIHPVYLCAHSGIDRISVPGPTFRQSQSTAAQLCYQLGHVHDGDRVEAARQSRKILHIVRPARRGGVNTPRSAPACRCPRACRRGAAAGAVRRGVRASPSPPPPAAASDPPARPAPVGTGIPGNDSCKHTPHSPPRLPPPKPPIIYFSHFYLVHISCVRLLQPRGFKSERM